MKAEERSHYPGYDVLAKRRTLSWNEQTREVIDARLAMPRDPLFFSAEEWRTLQAACDRLVPQPDDRPPIPVAAMVDHQMHKDIRDGFRPAELPPMRDAWKRGLRALEVEARELHGRPFHELLVAEQNALLKQAQEGALKNPAWGDMKSSAFFKSRMLKDVAAAYYGHPTAWNEMGFGGPASPRGYVRMGFDRRDPWEGVEVKNDDVEKARKENRRVG